MCQHSFYNNSYKTIFTIKITATATTLISLFTCLLLMNFVVAELLIWWRFADANEELKLK